MALGDLIGELGNTYLTAAERAAKAGARQTLADAGNTAAGPVARATQQLNDMSKLAPPFAPQAGQSTSQSLADATPPGVPAQPSATAPQSAVAPPAPLFQQPPAPSLNDGLSFQPPGTPYPTSFADLGGSIDPNKLGDPGAVAQPSPPVAVSPAVQAPVASLTQAPLTPAQPPNPNASLGFDQYRPVVVGSTPAAATSIVGRLGADGTAQLSNAGPDLAKALGQPQISAPVAPTAARTASLSDAAPGATPSFASLGTASNLGDGIGTFSQSNAGDAKLALDRNTRANDLRQGYREQDALARARQQANIDNSFTTVRDSSKPLTRNDLAQAGLDQQARVNDQQAISTAQTDISTGQAQRAAALQARQAQNLDDVRTAAAAPNATDAQKAAYQSLIDPTGEKTLALQTQRASLANTQAETALRLQQQKNNDVTQTQAQQDRVRAQAGKVATIDQAIGSVDALLGTQVDPKNPNGPRLNEDPGLVAAVGRSSILPTIPGGDAADFEARLDVLKAQSFLPQVEQLKGAGALSDAEGKKLSDSVGALSTKMSEGAFRKSLQDIRTTFAAAKARLPVPATAGASTSQASSTPTVTSKAQADALPAGSVFIGPDGKQYRK